MLYVDALRKILPWMFSLDHTNYARWLSVHVRDMIALSTQNPAVFCEFMKGNFTVRKTKHTFSSMAMDQAHEQMNEKMKGTAGLIGLTENPDAMLRWITSGPDVQRAV